MLEDGLSMRVFRHLLNQASIVGTQNKVHRDFFKSRPTKIFLLKAPE
jgi:hypothetical protein